MKLVNEVDEMLETGVQMGLSAKKHDVLEVGVVNVSINSKQTLEDHFDNVLKVLGEGYSQLAREDLLIVKLIFNPGHQKINVLSCADFQRSLDVMAISP